MGRETTAADVISRYRTPRLRHTGKAPLSASATQKWLQNKGMAASAVNLLMQRAFAERLVDAEGKTVDPETTTIVDTTFDDEGGMTLTFTAHQRRPVEMICAPGGYLSVRDADGTTREVGEWRDLPDILPAFIKP